MDRRNALKIMGVSLASAAMASAAPLTHAAVAEDRKKAASRLVFFFTATGNSLFVAKQLSDNPLSIPQELKKGRLSYEADEIGFVFPDFAAAAPPIVQEFVSKATFNAKYMFSVITYGNSSVNVCQWWQKFAGEHGKRFDYLKPILMVDNYLPVFDMNEQIKIDKHTDESLAAIISDISSHKTYIEPADMGRFNEEILAYMQEAHFTMTSERLLRLDEDRCIQCMMCSRVCPRGNFSLSADGTLSFRGQCEYCLACVHVCPQKALYLEHERNREARYRNPNIAVNEIIKANRQ